MGAPPRPTDVEVTNLQTVQGITLASLRHLTTSGRDAVQDLLSALGFSEPRHNTWTRARLHTYKTTEGPPRLGLMLRFETRTRAHSFLRGKAALLGGLQVSVNVFRNGTASWDNRPPALSQADVDSRVTAILARASPLTPSPESPTQSPTVDAAAASTTGPAPSTREPRPKTPEATSVPPSNDGATPAPATAAAGGGTPMDADLPTFAPPKGAVHVHEPNGDVTVLLEQQALTSGLLLRPAPGQPYTHNSHLLEVLGVST